MKIRKLTWNNVFQLLEHIDIEENIIYGVPKGGMILTSLLRRAQVVHQPERATMILDDIIDSGRTMKYYQQKFPEKQFRALRYASPEYWTEFPWESDHPGGVDSVQQNITRLLQYIGEDPKRGGLQETPDRVIKSYSELFAGYQQDPEEIFKVFDEPEQFNGLVYLRNIEFHSMCEHHMLPFSGEALIAYIPNGPVIGVSKLARLLDLFAKRLQIQERIGEQITEALMLHLKPKAAACLIEAKHLCMACRGVKKQNSIMGYNSLKGSFLEHSNAGIAARAELMSLWGRR